MHEYTEKQYLICYDISDSKRLQCLHRFITKHAIPIQYSVYYTYMKIKEMDILRKDIKGIINNKQDDVRIYTLPEHINIKIIGENCFSSDILLFRNELLWF